MTQGKESGKAGAAAVATRVPRRKAEAPAGRAKARDKARLTFEFYPETVDQLERVRRASRSATSNEAVRKALSLLDRHLAEVEGGAHAVYERPDGTRVEMVVV